jgi:hypothetical protein
LKTRFVASIEIICLGEKYDKDYLYIRTRFLEVTEIHILYNFLKVIPFGFGRSISSFEEYCEELVYKIRDTNGHIIRQPGRQIIFQEKIFSQQEFGQKK